MKKANYLEACSIFYFINNIRIGCLDQISRMVGKNDGNTISLSYLLNILYFNDYKELLRYLEAYGLDISYLVGEDSFEDETLIQSSFIKDWKIYDEIRNNEVLGKSWHKNNKIDEKKSLKKFPLLNNSSSKLQTNYFNNEDVPRKFIINGDWKKTDQISYLNKLSTKIGEINQITILPKKNLNESNTKNITTNSIPLIIAKKPEQKKITPFVPSERTNDLNEIKTPEIVQSFQRNNSKPKAPINSFHESPQTFANNIESKTPNTQEIQKEMKKKLLRKNLKILDNLKLEKCFFSLLSYAHHKKNQRIKKEHEKTEIAHLFYYDFRSDLMNSNEHYENNYENLKEGYMNFMNSLKNQKFSSDFISQLAYSMFRYSKPDQNKIFFKVCLCLNTLTSASKELSNICRETFCSNEKKMLRRRFNFKIDTASELDIFYCSRILQPLNESFFELNPAKRMRILKNQLKGSDLLIFIISEDYEQDAIYHKIFQKYITKEELEKINVIFFKASLNSEEKLTESEKKKLKKNFCMQGGQNYLQNFKFLNCDLGSEKKFLNKISLRLKNKFQESIRDQKFVTLKFVEIFSNVYHVLKNNYKDFKKIESSLKEKDFKSYFYNKNLVSLCFGKFYNSFTKSLNEIMNVPYELLTITERHRVQQIKKQQEIIFFMLENCFLDVMDKKYRKLIKSNLFNFFDYKILEKILTKYLTGFLLFEEEEITFSISKYFSPLTESFNFNQNYGFIYSLFLVLLIYFNFIGIGGCWNEFFLVLMKCLFFLFKRHQFFITIEKKFDFEIDSKVFFF